MPAVQHHPSITHSLTLCPSPAFSHLLRHLFFCVLLSRRLSLCVLCCGIPVFLDSLSCCLSFLCLFLVLRYLCIFVLASVFLSFLICPPIHLADPAFYLFMSFSLLLQPVHSTCRAGTPETSSEQPQTKTDQTHHNGWATCFMSSGFVSFWSVKLSY